MASFPKCPNCSSTKKGTKVRTCSRCKKYYCQDCNQFSMLGGPKCPHCGHTVFATQGQIK